jgi:hypothetical protein
MRESAESANSTRTHWSKDFVEHLRTVHFALILVATVLIIAGTNTDSSRLTTALTQIEQIAKFEQQWPASLSRVYREALLEKKLPTDWEFPYTLQVPTDIYKYESRRTTVVVPSTVITRAEPWKFPGTTLPPELKSLSDFRNLWDTFHRGVVLRLVEPPTEKSTCEQRVNLYWREFTQVLTRPYSSGRPLPPGCKVYDDAPDEQLPFELRFEDETLIGQNVPGEIHLIATVQRPLWEVGATYRKKNLERLEYESEITMDTVNGRVDESYFKRLFFTDWRSGNFETAFPELNSVSNGISTLEIADAVRRIEAQAGTAEKSVSVLGFAFPVAQLSQWGLLVLLAIQFYFWLHLHELAARLEPESEGWNVAWIGVYRTRVSTIATAFSCLVLPAWAAVTLAYRFSQIPFYYRRSMLAVCTLAVVLSVCLGLLTLRRLRLLRAGSPANSASSSALKRAAKV